MRIGVIRKLGQLDGRAGAFEKLADLVAGDPSVAGITLSLRRAMADRSLSALNASPNRAGLCANYLDAPSGAAATLDGDGFNELLFAAALAALILRCRNADGTDTLRQTLQRQCAKRAPLFAPEVEKAALHKLVRELLGRR